ncbi:MAG: hypothetical protein ACOCV7_03090 [Desulfonatronovibrionaceae bacterium]
MQINVAEPDNGLPVDRAYIVNIVIKSFKGRKDVEVHLYRPFWDESEEDLYDWDRAVAQDPSRTRAEFGRSRQVVLESFTPDERDRLIEYLQTRYIQRISTINSAFLSFPVPSGLMPLSMMPENENFGRIKFDQIPNYSLEFPVHGFYDLSAHSPIIAGEEI